METKDKIIIGAISTLKRLACAVMAALCVNISTPANNRTQRIVSQTSTAIKRVIKSDGWSIPGLEKIQSAMTVTKLDRGGKIVDETKLAIAEDITVELDLYGLANDSLYVRPATYVLRSLYSYKYQGKVFAYRVSLVPIVTGNDGIRHFVGAAFTFHYYDEDGDGRYEARYSDLHSETVPKWIN
jgi:hypothetical protein